MGCRGSTRTKWETDSRHNLTWAFDASQEVLEASIKAALFEARGRAADQKDIKCHIPRMLQAWEQAAGTKAPTSAHPNAKPKAEAPPRSVGSVSITALRLLAPARSPDDEAEEMRAAVFLGEERHSCAAAVLTEWAREGNATGLPNLQLEGICRTICHGYEDIVA